MPVRKKLSVWAIFVVAFQFAVVTAASAQDASTGQGIAQEQCARCHAVAKTDTSTHEQAPSFRQVVTRYPPASLAEALAEGIATGHPDMPEFVFSADQISDLIAYLETLQ